MSADTPIFRTIVVGTDGSTRATRAVEQAADLARTLDATLHIVQAYKGVEETMATAMASGSMVTPSPELGDVAKEEAEAIGGGLEALAASLRERGVTVETHVVSGSPVPVILETANAVGADLIVVGNRGMAGAKRLLGSVPNTLAHRAGCAVLIVRTDE
ncbi:MAG TPA: universal stress protein [Acidimicrobiia bacterium]|jgi:nucleotide-binding universal stress UspA family protein